MADINFKSPILTDQADDQLYLGDEGLRYLGHDRSGYGFVMFTPKYPEGKDFLFTLNPQSIDQDEEFAVIITPTQGGGKFIENQGNIFKDISISGTTGFLPLKNFKRVAGTALLQQKLTQIAAGDATAAQTSFAKVSGYDAFMRLRSLFREYAQIHRLESFEVRQKTLLYWLNFKDNEIWLVEPTAFRMQRASGRSPMTYNYSIRLRTISKGTQGTASIDPSCFANKNLNAVQRTLTDLRDRINAASDLLRAELSFFDQYRNLRSLVVSILDTGSTVASSLTQIASGAADVIDAPRSLLYSAGTNITAVFEGMLNAADLISSQPLGVLEGLTTLAQQFKFVLARPDLFEKKWRNKWSDTIENFNRTYGVEGDASASLNVGTRRGALAEATPSSGESIYQFAQRVSGDAQRAGEIIVLNNLRYPYFAPSADERLPGTVAPGDPVLVPVDYATNANDNLITTSATYRDRSYKDEESTVFTTNVITKSSLDNWRVNQWVGYTVEIVSGQGAGQSRLVASNTARTLTPNKPWTTNLNASSVFRIYFRRTQQPPRVGMVELLGVDLRIAKNADGLWDLVRDNTGDLALIRGTDNLNQALTVKFLTNQGELLLHPWFGLRPLFGQRGTPEAILRVRLYFEQTLLSDSRIESVESLKIRQERDKYTTEAKLAVKGGLRSRFASPLV